MATLFTVDFAAGDLTDFDSTTGTGLSVIAPGLVASNYCMAVNITNTNPRYGQIVSASDESQVRVFFAFDPRTIDPLVMADGDEFTMLRCRDNSANNTFRVELGYDASTGFQVRPRAWTDSETWDDGAWVSISANEHFVEVEWNASSGAGQDDGTIEMWVDVYGDDLGDPFGTADSSATGVDNDTRAAREYRLGANIVIDPGTSGTLWLDHLTANDDGTEIGHPGTLAFPRAQGAGRFSVGGREGTVYIVSNTNNTGAGSLREALEASGARIVVFTTDGTITLTSNINVSDPYISIYGQTAPGDGICVRDGTVRFTTHDIIIQHMRFRQGDQGVGDDSLSFTSNPSSATDVDAMAFNICVDHCSMSWGEDETCELWNSGAAYSFIKNVTFQWCIVSEALDVGTAAMGMILGSSSYDESAKNISIHHTLYCHNETRNPRIAAPSPIEIINCVMHDAASFVVLMRYVDTHLNYIGNTVTNQSSDYTLLCEPHLAPGGVVGDYQAYQLYLADNVGNYYVDDTWQIVGKGWGNAQGAGDSSFQDAWEADSAAYIANSQLTAEARATAYEKVLRCAGAFPRDSHDADMVDDVRDDTTGIISTVTAWPTLSSGSAGTDTDSDGMPDTWEDAHGTDDEVADDDDYDVDPMGWWTNIEIYAFTAAERCRKGAVTGLWR